MEKEPLKRKITETMKALFVATVVRKHIMEFHVPYLCMLKDMGFETAVAARNDYDDPAECWIPYCDDYFDINFRRNPFDPRNIKAYMDLKRVINTGGYDIIHCHTPVGGALTRLAARKARKNGSKVFYTAHGFHFYSGAPIINWVLFYPVERLLASFTDLLLTVNKEDYERAKRFGTGNVAYIQGVGVDTQLFANKRADNSRDLRAELGIPEDATVLLSVGEINKNKNHRLVIRALPEFRNVWYVICGDGPLSYELQDYSSQLSVRDRVIFAGYRNDVADYLSIADIFVFPSYREGLPVALVEAMASGLICIASRNRGTNDLMENSRLRFEASNVEELKEKLNIALSEDCSDEVRRNAETIKKYDIGNVLSVARQYYTDALSKCRQR